MQESEYSSPPLIETASNGLFSYLFPEEMSGFDNQAFEGSGGNGIDDEYHDSDVYTEASSTSTQRASDYPTVMNHTYGTYGMTYHNKDTSYAGMYQNDIGIAAPDNFFHPLQMDLTLHYPSNQTARLASQSRENGTLGSYSQSNSSTLVKQDSSEKRNQHNISEKKRIERMNICIDELYSLLESSGVTIRKNKVTILSESAKKIVYLESIIKELKKKVVAAENNTRRVMKEISYKPMKSSINYHIMFLQNVIPQALLTTDGQFVDANSQFCSLTHKTVEDLRKTTLFRFATPEDLTCAFGSYNTVLRNGNNSPGVCMIRHCCLGGCTQPVYFSLSLIYDATNTPSFFICNILPVLACACTDRDSASCNCNGLLVSGSNKLYQICIPSDLFPWGAKRIDSTTGLLIESDASTTERR